VVYRAPAAGGGGGSGGGSQKTLQDLSDRLDRLEKKASLRRDEGAVPDARFVSTSPAPAQVTVRLPADARLYIDNTVCPLTSDTRSFNTPTLQPGQEYFYTFRAEITRDGQTRSQSQRVVVAPGRRVTVQFNNFTPLQTVQR
jgi:uncharacterized protein (TIGR03000 family)